MFSQCIHHHHLAVLLFVILCSLTFLREERRTPRVLICKLDSSDLAHIRREEDRASNPLCHTVDIEANAGWMSISGCGLLRALYWLAPGRYSRWASYFCSHSTGICFPLVASHSFRRAQIMRIQNVLTHRITSESEINACNSHHAQGRASYSPWSPL